MSDETGTRSVVERRAAMLSKRLGGAVCATKPVWEEGTNVDERPKTKKPKKYKVLLHNDDYTTMEFVVWLLMKVFRRTRAEATAIMLHVHHKGVGVCGVYTREIAETKVAESIDLARESGMPLLITMEAE